MNWLAWFVTFVFGVIGAVKGFTLRKKGDASSAKVEMHQGV